MYKIFGLLAACVLLGTLACQPHECADLTKDGKEKCIAKDAIKDKTCVWENDACVEKTAGTAVKVCKDMKKKDDCAKATNCIWMADTCVDKTGELTKFMEEDRSFVVSLATGKTDVFGASNKRTIDWEFICDGKTTTRKTLEDAVNKITLNFKKNSHNVELVLNCATGHVDGKDKPFELTYSAKQENGNLLIKLGLNNKSAMAKTYCKPKATADSNQLEFFSKPNWFYVAKDNVIKGVSLVHDMCPKDGEAMDIKTAADAQKAIDYANTHAKTKPNAVGEENGKQVLGTTFMFKKK